MTLRHLAIFVTVCECGSVTHAAEKLFLAQPAVSLAISELEKYYGIHLFDRISRKLFITEAGKQFLEYSMHITGLFHDMETGMKNWDSIGFLRVGSSITIGTHFLPGYIERFTLLYPEIKVQVTVNNSKNIENMVLNNKVDFALIEGVLHSERLISDSFLEDELVLVCDKKNPLIVKDNISLEELKSQTFILRERESGTRELFDSTLLTYGISVDPLWESVSTGAIVQAVIKGLGISALPYHLVKKHLESKNLHRLYLDNIEFKRKFHIIYHKNKFLTKSALAFIQICKEKIEK